MQEKALTVFLKNIANLFKVKTILSLCVIITTCILTFKNVVSVEAFMAIASAIITYYFTRKEDTEEISNNKTENEQIIEEPEQIVENNVEESEG